MYALVDSLGLLGIAPYAVRVEVDVRRGLPGFDIVGLPDASVKESRDRVKSALQNMGYPFPGAKIVANLAPADTRKQGSVYDLPLLLAVLHAGGCESLGFAGTAVVGEIGLSGEVRGIPGVLPMVLGAEQLGYRRVVVPAANAGEAAVADGVEVYAAAHAGEVVAFLKGEAPLPRAGRNGQRAVEGAPLPDLADVRGQAAAKRALEVAAAGGHNLLLIGPPGTGKSMLAKRLPSILPPMSREESVQATMIYSVAGLLDSGVSLVEQRPFRAPHHTVSPAALTGGGSTPRPGELSLAHNGVLFLDELPEFAKNSLEALRQPLEDGQVTVSRVRQQLTYPARAMLVGAMNPCPCGFFGHPTKACTCAPSTIHRYLGRISGPLLDRIDLHVEVLPVDYEQMASPRPEEPSAKVAGRVAAARRIQQARYGGTGVSSNASIPSSMLREVCQLDGAATGLMKSAFDRLGLSGRAYDRILKVARTVADLEGCGTITAAHLSEAIQYRSLDRKYWGA